MRQTNGLAFGNNLGYGIWRGEDNIEFVNLGYGCSLFKLGNNGTALGQVWESYVPYPAIWSPTLGIQKLDILKDIPHILPFSQSSNSSALLDINSFGLMIGSYKDVGKKEHSFVWNKGKACEFSITEQTEKLGYQVISSNLIFINDRGSILGCFEFGHKHPLKDTWISQGIQYFLWDGELNLIPQRIDETILNVVDLNNNDEVLVNGYLWGYIDALDPKKTNVPKTFIWDKNSGLNLIQNNFSGSRFNDKRQIIGYRIQITESNVNQEQCVFDNGQLFYPLEKLNLEYLNFNMNDINNNGVILLQGQLWGENHVLKLTPIP